MKMLFERDAAQIH